MSEVKMGNTVNTIVQNKSEILFLYDSTYNIPNGDPFTGEQRYDEETKKILISDEKILSDCCEAIIGAIFIDRGFDIVKNYILKIWKNEIEKSNITILDHKTKLQEYSLKKFKKLPNYRTINSIGPVHSPTYKVAVSIINSKEYIGSGHSKQLAQLDAASKLLNDKNIS